MKSDQTKNYRTCSANTDSDFYENVRTDINSYYIYLNQKQLFYSLYDLHMKVSRILCKIEPKYKLLVALTSKENRS